MVSNWKKATSISPEVKEAVLARDFGLCVFCGRRGLPEAHYIPRAKGGRGIEQNILTVCRDCHRRLDGIDRKRMLATARTYLKSCYNDWSEEDLVYSKWRNEE